MTSVDELPPFLRVTFHRMLPQVKHRYPNHTKRQHETVFSPSRQRAVFFNIAILPMFDIGSS